MEKVNVSLYNRAWLLHSFLTFTRVVYPIIKIASWQKAYSPEEKSKIENLNLDLINMTETYIKTAILVLTAIGVLLDILVWASRKYAKYYMYYEICFLLLLAWVPFDYGVVPELF